MRTNVPQRFPSMRVLFAGISVLLVACGGGSDPVAVVTVSVTPASATVEIATTSQLSASALDANGGVISGRKVTWATSNASTATVSTGGVVTGVATGTVLISATIDGKVGNASIIVAPPPVATIAITPTSPTVVESDTLRLKSVLTIAGGTVVTGRDVTWTSASPAIATVSSAGLVTGVSAGTSVITATSEGKSATTILTVRLSPCSLASALPITSGQPIRGTLAPTDCLVFDGENTVSDLYTFTLATETTLEVKMTSAAFDAYLEIDRVNANTFTRVGVNDDADSTTTNARLFGTLSAGNYLIIANGFKVSATKELLAAYGDYTLTFTSPYTTSLRMQSMFSGASNPVVLEKVSPAETRNLLRRLRRQPPQ